jgi:hypothetical protein
MATILHDDAKGDRFLLRTRLRRSFFCDAMAETGFPNNLNQLKDKKQYFNYIWCRVARWFVLNQKSQIWVNFGGPLNGKCLCIL